MLCGKRTSDGQKVFAANSEKSDAPFQCLGCDHELVLKKGRIKVHHFAHKPPYRCSRGEGESDVHRRCKEAIYNSLKNLNHVSKLDVEVDFGSVIADVFCLINNVPVAIEVQKSNLSVGEITRRTSEYKQIGIYVIWIALYSDKLENEKYSPKAWEKWCHATYFGRVYYWLDELTIVPVHFSDYQEYVEERQWYNESGDEQYAGGYYKTSRRYKKPVIGRHLNLATDFKGTLRNSWTSKTISIPQSKLYIDILKKWW